MSKNNPESNSKSVQSQPASNLKEHVIAVSIIILSLVIFFNEVIFEGKVYISGDSVASKSFETVVLEARSEGIQTLWNPYIFCGMPGFASLTFSGDRFYDLTSFLHDKIRTYFNLFLGNSPASGYLYFYFIFAIGVYFYAYEKLNRKTISLFVSLATVYSTFIIIWIMVAHMTKIAVFAYFPFLLLVVEKLRKKFSLLWFIAGVIIVHFMLQPGHIQMIFYILLTLLFYYLFFTIRALIKKESIKNILHSGFSLLGIGILALAMTADVYFSTLEYSSYSTRGSAPTLIEQNTSIQNKSVSGGLDYDYATSWSFSPSEMGTFFIPSLFGFGNTDYKGILSNNQTIRINTYFGPQPFTDAPQFMGITILLLALYGIYKFRKDSFVQFLVSVILFSILVSFGKEFSLLYDFMYNYFPMFNKFRIPSMILVLVQFFIPLLAGYGILGITSDVNEKRTKIWKNILFASGGLFFISLIIPSIFESIYETFFPQQEVTQILSKNYGTQPEVLNELYRFISENVVSDITFALFLIASTSALIYFFLLKKLPYKNFIAVLIAIALIDLWRVNLKMSELHTKREAQTNFDTPNYVSFLKQDTTLYRVLEFVNGQPPYNNSLAYWKIQSAYGYQGAKMRNYQDVIDNIGLNNPLMWSLMNVKYIISDRADSNQILLPIYKSAERTILFNRFTMPRAFFVNSVKKVSNIEILKNIREMNFNPMNIAFTSVDIPDSIEIPTSDARANFISYKMNEVSLNVSATGKNLLFLSEVWYPKGWKAFLDGNEIPIYRLNYMFRGVVVPKGEHKLEMKFEPLSYEIGKNLSLGINIFAICILIIVGIKKYKK